MNLIVNDYGTMREEMWSKCSPKDVIGNWQKTKYDMLDKKVVRKNQDMGLEMMQTSYTS